MPALTPFGHSDNTWSELNTFIITAYDNEGVKCYKVLLKDNKVLLKDKDTIVWSAQIIYNNIHDFVPYVKERFEYCCK